MGIGCSHGSSRFKIQITQDTLCSDSKIMFIRNFILWYEFSSSHRVHIMSAWLITLHLMYGSYNVSILFTFKCKQNSQNTPIYVHAESKCEIEILLEFSKVFRFMKTNLRSKMYLVCIASKRAPSLYSVIFSML